MARGCRRVLLLQTLLPLPLLFPANDCQGLDRKRVSGTNLRGGRFRPNSVEEYDVLSNQKMPTQPLLTVTATVHQNHNFHAKENEVH